MKKRVNKAATVIGEIPGVMKMETSGTGRRCFAHTKLVLGKFGVSTWSGPYATKRAASAACIEAVRQKVQAIGDDGFPSRAAGAAAADVLEYLMLLSGALAGKGNE